MSTTRTIPDPVPLALVHHVRDHCLCLHAQRAARALARRFDEVLRPAGINNGQYSLMVALARPQPWAMGPLAELLAMDRTTLTAKLKPLVRRGLVEMGTDDADRRSRRLTLTDEGRVLLAMALPLWEAEHEAAERRIDGDCDRLRANLAALT